MNERPSLLHGKADRSYAPPPIVMTALLMMEFEAAAMADSTERVVKRIKRGTTTAETKTAEKVEEALDSSIKPDS